MAWFRKKTQQIGFSDCWFIKYYLPPKPTSTVIDVLYNEVNGRVELWIDGQPAHTTFKRGE